MGVDCFAAARRGAPPCPVPPRTAGGSLGCGAPLCFCPTLAPLCRRGTPSSLPCLLCPSALRPTRAQCGAIRVAALPLCPLSLPWPLGPVLPPVCSPSLDLTCPPSQVPWSLALGVSVPVLPLPSRHTLRGAIREAPLPLPLHLAVLRRPGSVRSLRPSTPAHFPLPPLPSSLSTLRRTLRKTLCRQVARMSQARTWPSLYDSTQDTAPMGVVCFAAARRGAPPCPVPPRTAGGSLGCGAPLCFCPTLAPSCRRGTPSSLPCSSAPLPSGQREHNVEQFAWQRSLFAPSLCPGPLALSCPLSACPPSSSRAPLPRFLGPWPSVSLSPSSLYPPGIHFAEQYARHPSHSPFTLPLPGALVPSAPARSLRLSTPALPPPPSPALFPLYTSQETTQDTL